MESVRPRKLSIDPDATEWVYFCYDAWLTASEVIIAHTAMVEGGALLVDSVSVGPVQCENKVWQQVYAVQVKAAQDARKMSITHRVTTSNPGHVVDLGRRNIDHTISLTVQQQ